MIDISVIVVSYNVRDAVVDCLHSLLKCHGVKVEIVVVDNASADGTSDLVASKFPAVHVIANADNRGFAAASNQGFKVTSGRNVLLLNPDTIVRPDALPAMAAFLDCTGDAGVVGCRIYDGDGKPHLSCFPLPSVASVFWQHWQLYRLPPSMLYTRYRSLSRSAAAPFRVGWVTGACFMIKRQVFARLGGLDERYFLFVEEVDLCRRAAQQGCYTYFLPSAGVTHLESRSTSQVVAIKLRSHYLSKLLYFAKFEPAGKLFCLRVVFLLELALKSAIRAAGLPFGKPPDARVRLRAYRSIAATCLTFGNAVARR